MRPNSTRNTEEIVQTIVVVNEIQIHHTMLRNTEKGKQKYGSIQRTRWTCRPT